MLAPGHHHRTIKHRFLDAQVGGTRRLYATASEMEKSKMVRKRLAATRKRKLEELKERKAKPKEISIPSRATPKNLSAVTGLSTIDILKVAIKCGVRLLSISTVHTSHSTVSSTSLTQSINVGWPLLQHEPRTVDDVLPPELVDILCEELYFVPRRSDLNEGTGMKLTRTIDEADMVPRPPIVAVMGHVNHGKTSLLDALRKTSVVDVEEGRITQRLSASMGASTSPPPLHLHRPPIQCLPATDKPSSCRSATQLRAEDHVHGHAGPQRLRWYDHQ
jgi:hypothetical protein